MLSRLRWIVGRLPIDAEIECVIEERRPLRIDLLVPDINLRVARIADVESPVDATEDVLLKTRIFPHVDVMAEVPVEDPAFAVVLAPRHRVVVSFNVATPSCALCPVPCASTLRLTVYQQLRCWWAVRIAAAHSAAEGSSGQLTDDCSRSGDFGSGSW